MTIYQTGVKTLAVVRVIKLLITPKLPHHRILVSLAERADNIKSNMRKTTTGFGLDVNVKLPKKTRSSPVCRTHPVILEGMVESVSDNVRAKVQTRRLQILPREKQRRLVVINDFPRKIIRQRQSN